LDVERIDIQSAEEAAFEDQDSPWVASGDLGIDQVGRAVGALGSQLAARASAVVEKELLSEEDIGTREGPGPIVGSWFELDNIAEFKFGCAQGYLKSQFLARKCSQALL
jgi:hypothetical protein